MHQFIPAPPKEGQREYHEALQEKDVIFVTGDAGSGKTYLAINQALKHLYDSRSPIKKYVL